jgi:hypothetical protein
MTEGSNGIRIWMDRHPVTAIYTAVVVTVLLVFRVAEVL